jgi:hypothetical protein
MVGFVLLWLLEMESKPGGLGWRRREEREGQTAVFIPAATLD